VATFPSFFCGLFFFFLFFSSLPLLSLCSLPKLIFLVYFYSFFCAQLVNMYWTDYEMRGPAYKRVEIGRRRRGWGIDEETGQTALLVARGPTLETW
jgi:hypothetical protein